MRGWGEEGGGMREGWWGEEGGRVRRVVGWGGHCVTLQKSI